ncbi:hypothetical protein AVEN_253886-1, partial [Araneus ventricosus]
FISGERFEEKLGGGKTGRDPQNSLNFVEVKIVVGAVSEVTVEDDKNRVLEKEMEPPPIRYHSPSEGQFVGGAFLISKDSSCSVTSPTRKQAINIWNSVLERLRAITI